MTPASQHVPLKVQSGLIHDWTGAAFIPNANFDDVLPVLRDYDRYKDYYRPNVVDAKRIATSRSKDQFSMVLMNKSVISRTALAADYQTVYTQIDGHRWYSVTDATRFQEIAEYDTPSQHILPENHGTGLIWRIHSITHFEERDGGVYIEVEAIALSRDIPSVSCGVHDPSRISTSPGGTAMVHSTTADGLLTSADGVPIHSFRFEATQEAIDDLRRRIVATRWPSKELVQDRSQGVQLAAIQALAQFWTTEYDWRTAEAKLNALPQFTTEIDGLTIHFIHVRSPHEDALPLIMTHGWPGSVIELLETIGPLTDPTASGGRPEDAFHLVLPSIPGYGFSEEPAELGWGPIRIGRAWDVLMHRLGYSRYVAQGGDVGSQVTDAMGRLGLDGLLGIHTNLLTPALGDPVALSSSPPTSEEQAALDQLDAFHATGTGYFIEQATRPETIGYALLDSPVALAAWMIDHDTDAYEKIARAFVDGRPSGNLTREHIVDNITLYWLTGTGASAARSYWEEGQENARAAGQAPTPVTIPVGFTSFPGEIWKTPRSWVDRAYPNVVNYFNEVDRGGHFAAWEEPELFANEMRATFRSLR